MPDRIKNIEELLRNMNGLGGGGGSVDVSSLATEYTLGLAESHLAGMEMEMGGQTGILDSTKTTLESSDGRLAALEGEIAGQSAKLSSMKATLEEIANDLISLTPWAGAFSPSVLSVASYGVSGFTIAQPTSRRLFTCFNNATQTLYLCFCPAASATSGVAVVAIPPQGYYEMPSPLYAGEVSGKFNTNATGNLTITEKGA